MGGELGGRAPIVVEYKLRQDAVAPPQDDHTTAVPIGVAEPGRDIFAMGERKEIKSQVLVFDVPDVADDEKQISMVEFEPPHATPEPSSGKEEDKVHLRMSHWPLDHEEAIADLVAHELYTEAMDAE
ncbi:hypothetical protein M405DRAFT_863348 [Rhizopogon salebrosus TDB-379]|nr:hypothetical protein M405DRAFT_863348 [Rhizopogon salebrosus TDB-379]